MWRPCVPEVGPTVADSATTMRGAPASRRGYEAIHAVLGIRRAPSSFACS